MQLNVTLDIPKETYNKFNAQAVNKDVAAAISERLIFCADYTAEKPIYINDEKRRELEAILGYNLSSEDELLKIVNNALSLKVGSATVRLHVDLLDRLKSRCFDGIDFKDFMKDLVVQLLEQYVGLR